MRSAVGFEDVSKRYPGGGARYASLRHDVVEGISRLRRFLRGERVEPQGTLALDRVSFEVQQGEAFAIIGPNGAGKTTILKLISRITYPSRGRIRVRGRVGALIEVGAGIHPELTGRENIWLYGQFLGMPRSEIRRRFDEIVEFAELGHVLDAPVKMYSTGMQLRLGFAIASHLEPDIFVVDEALAVGDAGFQAKCTERMTQLLGSGRTLVLVSHNLSAVEALCPRGMFLLEGRVQRLGRIQEVLRTYIDWVDTRHHTHAQWKRGTVPGRFLTITKVTLQGLDGTERYTFRSGEGIEVRLSVRAEQTIRSPWFSLGVSDGRPGALIMCSMLERAEAFDLSPGEHLLACRISVLPLAPRTYEIWTSVRDASGAADLIDWSCVGSLRIEEDLRGSGPGALSAPWMYGPVRVAFQWAKK
ncbi:MAG: ABC transporter ATP-binding protein [Candidatus Methylomirabilales bacterium]